MKIISTHETPGSDETNKPDISERTTCDNVIHSKRTMEGEDEELSAENRLANRIFEEGNGRALIKFCRELSGVIIRRYMVESDAEVVRNKVCASLVRTMNCTEQQGHCLVDLSMELIHARLHGKYRRSNVELSYLIATATGAVTDVGVN